MRRKYLVLFLVKMEVEVECRRLFLAERIELSVGEGEDTKKLPATIAFKRIVKSVVSEMDLV